MVNVNVSPHLCYFARQVYYYQDVKCREEMYDKDVIILQVLYRFLWSAIPDDVFVTDLLE